MPQAIQRLREDLQRPGGGWTTGVVTILAPLAIALVELLGFWPGPQWSAALAMASLLIIHMLWGAHGYYPRRI